MDFRVYKDKTNYDSEAVAQRVGKSIIIDSAESFYNQLLLACDAEKDIIQRYDYMRHVFSHAVNQVVHGCKIEFVGLFAKVDYCINEYKIPKYDARLIQQTRKELFPERNKKRDVSTERLTLDFPHNLKATALLIYHLYGKENIPAPIASLFPANDRINAWGKFDERVVRVIVKRWDDNYIWVSEEENNSEITVCYGEENTYLSRDGKGSWAYLKQVLWEGAQLNLIHIRKDSEKDVYYPELIIIEPDYLINITTIASCFTSYAESPFVNLINKISPPVNSQYIHLGNLAGQILDSTVHCREVTFEDEMKQFVSKNALSMIACDDFRDASVFNEFKEQGKIQKRNIEKLIGEDLPSSIGEYDRKRVVLEPSFFSEVLGMQGRFDFLHRSEDGEHICIIEQKSGKGEYVSPSSPNYNPNIPLVREQHLVQALLYRAIYQYELQRKADSISMMLLYSKYSQGLLSIPPMPEIFLRAVKIRNLLTWTEFLYAKEGMEILCQLTPEKLNAKHVSGNFWDRYTRPQLEEILSPIHNASELERLYFLRFMRFLENEQLLSKVGNKQKENSGFASIWHDTLEDKKSAGSIYDKLVIDSFGYDESDSDCVTSVTFKFHETLSADTTNFRISDIVILYPYEAEMTPDACADMVIRGSIMDIHEDSVEIRLRNPQTDKKIFLKPSNWYWAMEHDLFESSSGAAYSAMYSFLSATKRRRDLLLSQRLPEIDLTRKLKGDYGSFNTLSTHAKQAKDLFLIIGPPGTGKTSYGLVNLLKEELLEEGTNVLLLSYTNRAVDEICSKLIEIHEQDPSFDFIRIGSDLSCSEAYRKFLLSSRAEKLSGGNDVYQLIRKTRVFCGTTAAINSNISLLKLKQFSLAIIDEASQILEPQLVGLFSAKNDGKDAISRFVLIGDHKQLPAVVQQLPEESVVTEKELIDINLTDCRHSLFERLLKQFKTENGYDEKFVYMLTKQGRMHKDISEFPSIFFYDSKLDIVPLEHQQLPSTPVKDNVITEILTSRRVSFIASKSPLSSPSVKTNEIEANLIARMVIQIYNLKREGFSVEKTIGVIVPYRNQISTVRNAIDRYGIKELHDITIDTVERYQGSQRDYIIYGFTVQQPYQLNFLTSDVFEEDGMIIDRRLNVAMTRARLNLILIGNPDILRQNITFSRLIDFVKDKGGYYEEQMLLP